MDQEYVDGFLLSVPRDNLARYKEIARKAGEIWKEHGALDYRECVENDLQTEGLASFRTVAGARDDEVVVFSWIRYASRTERDRINAAVMADPRLTNCCADGVFDMKRMAYGGFEVAVSV